MIDPSLGDLSGKLDKLLEHDDMHLFDRKEVETLQAIIAAWRAADGFLTVTKRVGVVLACIVLIWTQWERVLELIRAAPRGAP